ncbi:MAG: hypothetical protein L0215_00095 [Gemmataceae bacterium]|nr:hypothetical protein [Gemmataceae bacterium]
MGWLRYLFLGDLGQQLDLSDQSAEIASLRQQLNSMPAAGGPDEKRIETLQRENDELKLYLAAVFRLLITKGVATAEEIRDLVSALDREDGDQDKKYGGGMMPKI